MYSFIQFSMNVSGQYWNNGVVYLNRKNTFQIWPKVKNKIVSITDQLFTLPNTQNRNIFSVGIVSE
jgi:hypothetical protein